jgi:tRNA pseudouridine32 synthase/23S rRNA pseudouridine746 synthase
VTRVASPHDPPVTRLDRTPAMPVAAADVPRFLADALAEAMGDPDRAASVLHHGGLWIARRAWAGEALAAGVPVTIYAFTAEPAPLPGPPPALLYDADGLVAVDKPAFLPMQGTRASRRFCLEHMLRERLGAPGLIAVHRLDRETSGVALFARDPAAAARMERQFRERRVRKTYLAVVAPQAAAAPARFDVSGHLVRRPHPAHAFFALAPEAPESGAGAGDATHSETRFARLTPLAPAPGLDAALLAARPITGRTHQIRVHCAHRGHAIVGDALYGGAPATRLQLHAAALTLYRAGGAHVLAAAPPAEFLCAPATFDPEAWDAALATEYAPESDPGTD